MAEGSYADWSKADIWYAQFYMMESRYHEAMACRPPQIEAAFNIFRQMHARTAWALTDKQNEKIEKNLSLVRQNLYDSEFSEYSWAFSVRLRRKEKMQESIDLLSEAQKELFKAMDKKKMLIPMSKARSSGYGTIGAGGVME